MHDPLLREPQFCVHRAAPPFRSSSTKVLRSSHHLRAQGAASDRQAHASPVALQDDPRPCKLRCVSGYRDQPGDIATWLVPAANDLVSCGLSRRAEFVTGTSSFAHASPRALLQRPPVVMQWPGEEVACVAPDAKLPKLPRLADSAALQEPTAGLLSAGNASHTDLSLFCFDYEFVGRHPQHPQNPQYDDVHHVRLSPLNEGSDTDRGFVGPEVSIEKVHARLMLAPEPNAKASPLDPRGGPPQLCRRCRLACRSCLAWRCWLTNERHTRTHRFVV